MATNPQVTARKYRLHEAAPILRNRPLANNLPGSVAPARLPIVLHVETVGASDPLTSSN